jgi:subtilisin family serine protease
MSRASACLAMILLLAFAPVQAGTLSPELERRLQDLAPDEPVPVLVFLRERAPVEQILTAQKARGAKRGERHREVIRALQAAAESQRDLLATLDEAKVRGAATTYRSFWISNMVSVTATREEIVRIAARPDVRVVAPTFHARLLEPVERGPGRDRGRSADGPGFAKRIIGTPDGIRAIHAPQVWHDLGITGEGVVVANLDTGVDGTHPALRDRWRGQLPGADPRACWFRPGDPESRFPEDDHGHGTHVMGTITGLGVGTRDSIGVAWGATWIAADIFGPKAASAADSSGPADGDQVIEAFQWFADPDGDPETIGDVPDVVQNSWGTDASEGAVPCDPTWWEAIDNCEAAGVVVTWSAGNSGPRAGTMIVPADRATTPTRNFSVGAVDATNSPWPYPVADFSSRGPSLCTPDGRMAIKPEVVAPGVMVYSSVPGGEYEEGWSGTSMAGPHAAGVVALIRQANPDLDPDTIKQILMETTRSLGPGEGETNDTGWGFIDAYAAVSKAMEGFGRIEGTVWNGSVEGLAVPDAAVDVLETAFHFRGKPDGRFGAAIPAEDVRVVASHSGFAAETLSVRVAPHETIQADFHLRDVEGPWIQPVGLGDGTTDTLGPYPVRAVVTDPSGVARVALRHRRDRGPWQTLDMEESPAGSWQASIPGAPANTRIDYSCVAIDRAGLASGWPAGAPDSSLALRVWRQVYATSFESPPEPGWQAGVPGDNVTSGTWVQADPVGTFQQQVQTDPPGSARNGPPLQPEDDHTPGPGTTCFVTGNGEPGGPPSAADVDNGCTTLLSPVFHLGNESEAFVSYARWFNMGGSSADDTFFVDVSADGGSSWVALERVGTPDTLWHTVNLRLNDVTSLTDRIRLRFVACDLHAPGITEAALDDASVQAFTPRTDTPGDGAPATALLFAPAPNPARRSTAVRFRLPVATAVDVTVIDLLGRRVKVFPTKEYRAGEHTVVWDGRDERGRRVASGLYYVRLGAGGAVAARPVVILD